MNETQRRYAKTRLDEIYRSKLADIKLACKIEAKVITAKQKLTAIKSGKGFTIDLAKIEHTLSSYWYNAIQFDGEQFAATDTVKQAALTAPLLIEKNKIMDELMLGDEAKALEAIRAFTDYKIN